MEHRIFKTLMVAAIFTVGMAPSVQAHTTLSASSPDADSKIVIWPAIVKLTFSEDLTTIQGQQINFLTVTNAMGDSLNIGKSIVFNNQLSTTVKTNTVNGLVLVNYRVAAQDGHIDEGEFAFTYGTGPQNVKNSASPLPLILSSPSAHHGGNQHLGIYASTTVLIVLALLFGFWIYRKD
jgi:methionine-rich copper-binding protein CopC